MFGSMKFKYISNQTEDSADILIHSEIGSGLSERISEEINFLVNVFGIRILNVRINSGGGSMLEGFGIFSSLHNAINKGVIVNTINEGVSASMAGLISQMATKRKMVDFGLLMLHNPNFGGASASTVEEQEIINKFRESVLTMFEGATGIERTTLEEMMDKETWLDSSQALELGFIDEIIVTGQKTKKKAIKNLFKTNSINLASVMNVINLKEDIKPKNKKMLKNVTSHLGLSEDASEESILEAITNVSSKVSALETENSTLKKDVANKTTEIETLSASVLETKKAGITAKVEEAITKGKIKEESKDSMITLGVADESQLDMILDSVKEPEANLLAQMEALKNKGGNTPETKTLRELEKDSPEKVADLLKNNIEEYKRLYKEEYKAEYSA